MTAALEDLRKRAAACECEATAFPFWVIIDPPVTKKKIPVGDIAHCVTGVWFSREAAEEHLRLRRYRYSERAVVWCASGHMSQDWRALLAPAAEVLCE